MDIIYYNIIIVSLYSKSNLVIPIVDNCKVECYDTTTHSAPQSRGLPGLIQKVEQIFLLTRLFAKSHF